MATYKYLLDFQKLLKPDDTELEFKCEKFHKYYDFCRCPLLRDSMNPDVSILFMIFNYKYRYIFKALMFY